MVISIKLPGWLARRMVIHDLKSRPLVMGMQSTQCRDGGIIRVKTVSYFDQETINYLADGAEANGCDVLTFARTVKQFRSIDFRLDIKMSVVD
jgi:hypothetical protein